MRDSLLKQIESPDDIKNLSIRDLSLLSSEIRKRIIQVLSENGGHLASNLGTVELTIALHKVFSAPYDKFVFDTSHQTYTHKILTGRNANFEGIRKFKGLSGFASPKESEYDHFYGGHAGTAFSLGLGLAKSRDLNKSDEHIIPVVGDAALTCGLVFEALNNLPKDLSKFIVVLNDNAMAISKNIGAITNILSRFINNPTLSRFYQDMESFVSKIPGYGPQLAMKGQKVVESIKNLVSPAVFFEQYGLSYIGPVDGHDIKKMVNVFSALRHSQAPVLVHVLTVKGKGLPEAMMNPVTHHGAKPFNPDSGKFLPQPSKKLTFPKVFGKHVLEMADRDANLVIVTPAMSFGSSIDEVMKKYPDRCLDVGIAESHAVTFCGGLAYNRKNKVIVSIYATFLQRALDNLFHDICLQELPVVFAIDRAGIAGGDGATHNGVYDMGFLQTMPNMVICQPRNGDVLKELLNSVFSWRKTVAIRYPNLPTTTSDSALEFRECGKAEVLHKGKDLLIIALGHMVSVALDVKEKMKELGIQPTIVDPVFVKPLDKELLKELLSTHQKVVIIEEHSSVGGLSTAFNHFIMQENFEEIQTLNIGVPEVFVEQGSHEELSKELMLDSDHILERVLSFYSLNKLCVV